MDSPGTTIRLSDAREAWLEDAHFRRLSPVPGTRCIALDGHVCHSLGEKTIDDTLHRLGVAHEREPRYPGGAFRGDFLVGDAIVEYRGLTGEPAYDAKQKLKRAAAVEAGLRVIDILPADVVNLASLRRKLGLEQVGSHRTGK